MARRYFVRPLPPPGEATLSPKLGHFLGRVVRTRPGTDVVLFDGTGAERHARVLAVDSRDVHVEVGDAVAEPLGREPRITVDVVCAFPRRPRTDWLLEHGTEVGIRSFRPLVTERTNRTHPRPGHWERVLIGACAQSDRAVLPTIEPEVTLDGLLDLSLPEERYVATAADVELGPAISGHALFVVGPEGGLGPHEVARLTEAGFAPRSLGPLTLRTETAVLAAATRLLQARD